MRKGSEELRDLGVPEWRDGEAAVDAALRAFGVADLATVRFGTPLYDKVARAREIDVWVEQETRQRERRAADFDFGLCPELYRDTDPQRLPEAAGRVLDYAYGPKGLLVHGESGRGKTRAMWLLIRRLHVEDGRSLAFRDALEFTEEAVAAYRLNNARSWAERMTAAQVLFLDDLGKGRITQRVGEGLFAVVDRRAQRRKPTFITTNFVGETFKLRFEDQETAEPLIRRLKEFFIPVAF